MAIIKNISEVKKYVRISNYNEDSTIPDMDAAAVEHLIPFCGEEIYAQVEDGYEGGTLQPNEEKLLHKMQRPLAAWAYYDDLAFINATITDRGVTYTQTEEMPPVSRWSYNKLKGALLDRALQGTERLLEFLENNSNDFPKWQNSNARKSYKKLLIRSGYEFSKYYPLYQPLRTYISMKSIMAMVEDMYIQPTIGKDFLETLKTDNLTSAEEKTIVEYLKKALTYRTIWQAIQELPVRISDNGFTVVEGSNPDGTEPGRTADNSVLLDMKMKAADREATHYLVRAKEFLDEHAGSQTFPLYYNSDYYTDPASKKKEHITGNDNRKLFRL